MGPEGTTRMKTLTVLLVEDNADYAALVRRWLSGNPNQTEFVLQWTDSLAAALARLDQGGVDLLLLDLGLPDSQGLDTWLSLREKASGVPAIILSGDDDETLALQAIQQGAQEYLGKSSCTLELLLRTLRHTAARYQSHKKTVHAEESMNRAKIVAVAGASGGAGATTVAAILAAELRHHTDEATLLMDLDLSPGLAAFICGVDPPHSVQDALECAGQLDRSIWEGIVASRVGGVDILAGARTTALGDPNLESLRKVLDYAGSYYRWIVMDLGRLNYFSKQVVGWADEVILVTAPSLHALHQCKHAIAIFDDLAVDRERIGLILNRKENAYPVSQKEVQNLFGIQIAANLPPAFDDLHEACLQKRLPNVTGDFRLPLTAVARKLAGLPCEAPRRSLLSLTSFRDKLLHRGKAAGVSVAS
jgi:Flp pilus assembly CpaE family ATPase